MRVVVTGAAGRLARVVLPLLCARDAVERVVGIDRNTANHTHRKFSPLLADIADRRAHAALHGADALVNLAFVVLRGRMPLQTMEATNVDATKALLAAAGEAGIPAIVHLSSAAVYGCGSALTEDAPLAPLPRFHYARHKARVDAWLARHLPHAAILRPTIVLGPNAHPLLETLLGLPVYVRVPDPQPRLSLVHEDDVAQAIALALDARACGAFNLAARGTFVMREHVRARHALAPGMPPRLAGLALRFAWSIAGWGGAPGWIDGATAPLTLDCARARRVLGWRPRYDDCESILAAGERRPDFPRAASERGARGSQNSE